MKIKIGRLKKIPPIRFQERQKIAPLVDLNQVSPKTLASQFKFSEKAVQRFVTARGKQKFRNLNHAAEMFLMTSNQKARMLGKVYGTERPEVIFVKIKIENERVFSNKSWTLLVEFLPPTEGYIVMATAEVIWRGEPFKYEWRISESDKRNTAKLQFPRSHSLPPGPIEVKVALYDNLGGAASKIIETMVFPSNPFTLFLSALNRSIYNGSIRPDWQSPNWVTGANVSFVNGDNVTVRLNQNMTWRFWDGGVGGTLVESGDFTWPHQITVSPFGNYSGWMTFNSPPGSPIHNRYEDMEDMSLEMIFTKTTGGTVSSTITCRIMGGWGINIIQVGSYTATQRTTIANGINDARNIFENHGLTFSSVDWWIINDPGGYRILNSRDEWSDLLDDWTVNNDSVDCFVVEDMWDSFAGWSPIGGPDSKDSKSDGLAVDRFMGCFAHELGHYMGDHGHADSLGNGNVMHSTCGGTNFTYDQYKDFFKHSWTRIVR